MCTEESVEVPLAAVRRWLAKEKPEPLGEWDDEDDWEVPFGEGVERLVICRATQSDGTERWRWANARALRPGDTVVVPSEWGGLDAYGWAPDSTDRVVDVSELAALVRERPVLRLDEGLPERLGIAPPDRDLWEEVWQWRVTDDADYAGELAGTIEKRVRKWLEQPEWTRSSPWDRDGRLEKLSTAMSDAALQRAATRRPMKPDDEHLMLVPVALLRPEGMGPHAREVNEDSADGTAHLDTPVLLSTHHVAVGERALQIATALGLPDPLVGVVVDAARWHDLGKVDPRFQAMLFDGDATWLPRRRAAGEVGDAGWRLATTPGRTRA